MKSVLNRNIFRSHTFGAEKDVSYPGLHINCLMQKQKSKKAFIWKKSSLLEELEASYTYLRILFSLTLSIQLIMVLSYLC
jgi:hypothetical protein